VAAFREFLLGHGGEPTRVAEVVCDMSPAFLAALAENFANAAITVDWFHVVQLFTTTVDQVRKAERRVGKFPKATRWAVLKAGDANLSDDQRQALAELESGGYATAKAYRAKECCAGYGRPAARKRHAGGSLASSTISAEASIPGRFSNPSERRYAPSRYMPIAFSGDGNLTTPKPASKE
jgi:transposase